MNGGGGAAAPPREHVHFVGICGSAMGGLALALARAGHPVTGSDERVYDPMRGYLAAQGIAVAMPHDAANLPAAAELVVAGRRVNAANPELRAARTRGLPVVSFPVLLRDRFLHATRNAVVAGGVGKTTTTAMLAWILEHAGRRPDYLVGGLCRNLDRPARFGSGDVCVLEGDEYASAHDDVTPKFLYYAPEVVVVTNLLEDHPDLYPDRTRLVDAFLTLVSRIPPHGCLVSTADVARTLAGRTACRVLAIDHEGGDARIENVRLSPAGSSFDLDGVRVDLRLHGPMNVRNAAMAAVAARALDVPLAASARALCAFDGLVNRQDTRQAGARVLVTDKASHPASIGELAAAIRQRFPDRRVLCVLQPRATGGRRWIYQRDLPDALARFDAVLLTDPYEHRPPAHTRWEHEPFSIVLLRDAVARRGIPVSHVPRMAGLPAAIRDASRDGDVIALLLREQFADAIDAVDDALSGVAASS